MSVPRSACAHALFCFTSLPMRSHARTHTQWQRRRTGGSKPSTGLDEVVCPRQRGFVLVGHEGNVALFLLAALAMCPLLDACSVLHARCVPANVPCASCSCWLLLEACALCPRHSVVLAAWAWCVRSPTPRHTVCIDAEKTGVLAYRVTLPWCSDIYTCLCRAGEATRRLCRWSWET